jgi:anthranilate synthase component 1
MKRFKIETICKRMLADVYTPVGIYLRIRDRFRDTILLESADHHSSSNSFSFICINAIAGIEVRSGDLIEIKYPGLPPQKVEAGKNAQITGIFQDYMQRFECNKRSREEGFAQGLFGYSSYDAVQLFEKISFKDTKRDDSIPLMRYRLYQYVIVIDHFKDELFICENRIAGIASEVQVVESLIRQKDVPAYPFALVDQEASNMSDEDFISMAGKGIASCRRGDVFQVVLSRRFSQGFRGDEFNLYRALRSVNPSPYLFYFDYGDYRLMGSSPEAHLKIANGIATIHPIAGTFKRSGDDEADRLAAEKLLADPKENAEHVMLVDLARNDLSRLCTDVSITHYREVQFFSHVIHLVSEVSGRIGNETNPFAMLASTFPAGTLSGAPKFKAMQLIDSYEPTARGFYGGAIGFIGFNGSCNHAIMIRTVLSAGNILNYQAGAGIVVASDPESELREVNNKLGAIRRAMELALSINVE